MSDVPASGVAASADLRDLTIGQDFELYLDDSAGSTAGGSTFRGHTESIVMWFRPSADGGDLSWARRGSAEAIQRRAHHQDTIKLTTLSDVFVGQ
jgi:hypothetical protein